MRHSDIRLTMEIYNDDQLHDLREEVVSKRPAFRLSAASPRCQQGG